MWELLYRMKYKSDKSVLKIIIDTVAEFINNQGWKSYIFIPTPPSLTSRSFQPVLAIAKCLSKLVGISMYSDCIVKIKETHEHNEVYEFDKRMELLKDAYVVVTRDVEGRKFLLFDNLCRSGITLNAISQILKHKGKVSDIYAFTLTKTRRIKWSRCFFVVLEK